MAEFKFDDEFTKFGLLSENGYVFCILTDDKPTVHEQANIIDLTGAELVKVHGVKSFEMIEEIKEIEPTKTEINTAVFERKNAFKGKKPEKLNKSIPIKFTPNITTKLETEIKSTVLRNEREEILPIPEGLPADEVSVIAKLTKSRFVVVRFKVVTELLPKASPYRSQAKIR